MYQLDRPSSSITDGTRTRRTRLASMRMDAARPSPKTFKIRSGSPITKEPKTQIMMAAAEVMTRAVLARPSATDEELSPVRRHSSRMRLSRKTS